MKKNEILKKKGIKIHKVNKTEKALAKTDYQRNANYMVTTSNGRKFFSTNGSLKDALAYEKYATKNSPKKVVKKTTKPTVKKTTKPAVKKTTKHTTSKKKKRMSR